MFDFKGNIWIETETSMIFLIKLWSQLSINRARNGCEASSKILSRKQKSDSQSIERWLNQHQRIPHLYMTPLQQSKNISHQARDQQFYLPQYKPETSKTYPKNSALSPDSFSSSLDQNNVEDDSGFESLVTNISESGNQDYCDRWTWCDRFHFPMKMTGGMLNLWKKIK